MRRPTLTQFSLLLFLLVLASGALALSLLHRSASPEVFLGMLLLALLAYGLLDHLLVRPLRQMVEWGRAPLSATPPRLPRLHLLCREMVEHMENLVSLVGQMRASEEGLRDQYVRLQGREKQLEGLHEAARILGAGAEPEEWFPHLGAYLGSRFDLLGMDLYLHDPEADRLVRRATWADRPDYYDDMEELSLPLPSVCGRAFLSGSIQNIGRVERCDYYIAANDLTRSQLALPLVHWGKRLGVLNLESGTPEGFAEEDRFFFQGLSELVGQEVDNALQGERRQQNMVEALTSLARAVELRDPYTGKHQARVADLAVRLAERLEIPHRDVETIRTAALLHDIGKIGIPDALLLKPSRLTEEEYALIRSHPVKGDELLSKVSFLYDCRSGVRGHHERWDGTGYPDGLAGEAIPLTARIIAIADAFDAMTTLRVYRTPFTSEEACAELRAGAGRQFDPSLVESFVETLGASDLLPSPPRKILSLPH
jgi:putative nucleotidyltransferase with HDIG domain